METTIIKTARREIAEVELLSSMRLTAERNIYRLKEIQRSIDRVSVSRVNPSHMTDASVAVSRVLTDEQAFALELDGKISDLLRSLYSKGTV